MNICFPLKSLYCLSYKSNLLMDKPIIVKLNISAEMQNFQKYIYSFFHNQNSTKLVSSITRGPSKTRVFFQLEGISVAQKKNWWSFWAAPQSIWAAKNLFGQLSNSMIDCCQTDTYLFKIISLEILGFNVWGLGNLSNFFQAYSFRGYKER